MSIASIMGTSATLPGLDPHAHAHKRGVHGDSNNESSADPADASAPPGTSLHLFSHLMNSTEEMMGVNPAAASRKP